jgi:DNA-binding NarL/FixJ family response regulator
MPTIRVLIVEDEPLIAEDIRDCLTNVDYSVVAVAHNKEQALAALKKEVPDLALLDINLGKNMDGLEIAKIINEEFYIPFIFLTSYSNRPVIEKAKITRPMGYIMKPFNERDLYSSIEIALYNFSQGSRPRHFNAESLNQRLETPLTDREFEILKDIYEGNTNKQLAAKHFVSINTIKTHIQNIYDKLDVHSRAEAIAQLRDLLS